MDIQALYQTWLQKATEDPDLIEELKAIDSKEEMEDRFYRELSFGTAGLRGVIGAGTNRMNIYTVRKATQGLAEFILAGTGAKRAAIAYDSRNKSELFAKEAACVLSGNGIEVFLYSELMPTPMLSFAVRNLKCSAGIVITASHNPAKYNGYKAYGPDGCQMNTEDSALVMKLADRVPMFSGAKYLEYEQGLQKGLIHIISDDVIQQYLDCVQSRSLGELSCPIKVVYTPLNGAGNKPVRAILKRIGVTDVTVVPEQELPDGNFPTAPYPNPEIKEALGLALQLAHKEQPDLVLATDPDCDRVGIAVRHSGDYRLMTGNEVGVLLLHYLLSRRKEQGTLPQNPVAVKTIVTTELAARVAKEYGCQMIEVLTGFKYIGEQIGLLEAQGEDDRFLFGFEESYGYLAGSYVRDKDAVVASMLICEMTAFYKAQGKSLDEMMEQIYRQYGMFLNSQHSYTFEGESGMKQMACIMDNLRSNPPKTIGGEPVEKILDYETGVETCVKTGQTNPISLPKSQVLAYHLPGGANVIVRPSGTEPKMKIYLTAKGSDRAQAEQQASRLLTDMSGYLK